MGKAQLMRARLPIAGLMLTLVSGVSRAEEAGGMPQLNPDSFLSQVFWLAVFFFLTFVFLNFIGLPRITRTLAERNGKIEGDLGAAETSRTQAVEAEQAYAASIATARTEARRMLAETHEQNLAKLSERTHAAAADFDQRVKDATSRIEAARQQALAGLRTVAQELAADITGKLVDRVPSPDSVARAVDRVAGAEIA